MRAVHTGPVMGLVSQFAVIVALAATVGVGERGWFAGVGVAVTVNLLLARGLARHGAAGLGPADRVTLARATLTVAVAALVADSFDRPTPVTTLVGLTALALLLDAVDGWVARRTRTASALGALFDQEVDAFLILVLSVYVARSAGVWVLAIGTARYAFLVAGWLTLWLREPLPPRYWGKVVAAIQGVVLTIAAAGVLPGPAITAALIVAMGLLAESFARAIWWLSSYRGGVFGQSAARTPSSAALVPSSGTL